MPRGLGDSHEKCNISFRYHRQFIGICASYTEDHFIYCLLHLDGQNFLKFHGNSLELVISVLHI